MKNAARGFAVLLPLMLLACFLAVLSTPAMADENPPLPEQGTWAVGEYEGRYQADTNMSITNWDFEYNELGQVTKSYLSTRYSINLWGSINNYTWSDDGLSYKNTYTSFTGSNGENHQDGETSGTYQIAQRDMEVNFTSPSEHTSYTLEYREDGTLARKVVKGDRFDTSVETYEYDEREDLARYTLISNSDGFPDEECAYDIEYDGDAPVRATVIRHYSSNSDDEPAPEDITYELALQTDENGNIVSVERDGNTVATCSWVYAEHPNPYARLFIHAQLASIFERL